MLNIALKYLQMNISVIPLKMNGKEPLIKWTEFQNRRASEDEVKEWFSKWPDANLGIVTGPISNLCVIDLDGPQGLEAGNRLGLQSSMVCLTGNGKHLYYQCPISTEAVIVNSAGRIAPGVDIRGEGGYVVAPPSIHENGNRYRWSKPFVSTVGLSKFPKELLIVPAVSFEKRNETGWISQALEDLKDGNIDETLFRIASRLRNDGYTASDALSLLRPHADRVGAEAGHLEQKIENVWGRYEPNDKARRTQLPTTYGESTDLVIHSPDNNDSWEQYENRREMDTANGCGLSTGYHKLDEMCKGGLKSSRLFTVAALTSHGKTNFGIGLAKNVCEQGKTVLYFSTEYTYQKIWERYIATLKDPNQFREHKFNVCDGFTPSIEQVEEAIIRIKPDVFIFDYIQHVSKEKEKLTEFMKGCQFLQRKYNLQGVILAQLNRSADWVENGERVQPRMSMIEGSATIEQASSRVLLLSMTKQSPEYNEILGVLDKNDDGDTGVVHFALYKNPYHLEEL